MIKISTIWIILLISRNFLGSIGIDTFFLTFTIFFIQMTHFMLHMNRNQFHIEKYYFSLIFFILLLLYNKDTLATLNILLSIILLRSEKIECLLRIILRSYLFIIIVYLFLYYNGYLLNSIMRIPKGIVFTFGFSNSNSPGEHILNITLLLALHLIISYRINKLFLLPLVVPNLIIYSYSLSRTSLYSALLFFILIIIIPYSNLKFRKFFFIKFLPFFLLITTIFICLFYYKFPFIDLIFSGRFSINSKHLMNLKPHNFIFGYILPAGKPMDSAYLAQFFAGGLLSICLFIKISQNGIFNILNSNTQLILAFIVVVLIAGFTENTFSEFSAISVIFYKLLITKERLKVKG